jgi:lipid-A-disaccharide synthase-like uncharacterized protein
MTPKGFIAGCFLLGGLLLTLYGIRANPYVFVVGLIATLYGGITLFRMRKRKIDVTK